LNRFPPLDPPALADANPQGAIPVPAGRRARRLGGLVLVVFCLAISLAAQGAVAAPLVTGCCDSLTDPSYANPGYLAWIQDVYGVGEVADQAVAGRVTAQSLVDLRSHLASSDPEVVVVLAGTTDPYWLPGATLATTQTNIGNMVAASVNPPESSEAILVAPPPVLDPCTTAPSGWSCAQIDDFLAALGEDLRGNVAAYYDVPFIDLYAVFDAYLPYVDLYGENGGDGVHPSEEGDLVIAQAVLDELAQVVGAPCDDGVDNDGDGFVDYPADAGCDDASDWSEDVPALDCDDGVDNDGDGAVDLEDFGCHSRGDFSERSAPNVIVCDDGIDNDGDGLTDFPEDPGCGFPLQTTENPACNDGVDNDGDGLIDFDGGQVVWGECTGVPGGCPPGVSDPDGNGVANPDPTCSTGSRTKERSGCGLGFELGLLLPPLLWWHRRRTIRR